MGFTESPGAMALGAGGDVNLARKTSRMLAEEMHAVGINHVYAPVVDVTHDISNPSVGTRSIGTDPQTVAAIARAQIEGFQSGGVAATAKHFPGLGNTSVDTHEALAVIDGSLDYLWDADLVPFRAAVESGVATIMLTHVKFTELDADYPATFAHSIATELLRDDIDFTGATTSDCLEMRAITDHYTPGESAVKAAKAGIDLILFSHTQDYQAQAYEAMVAAVESGELSRARVEEAAARITALKGRYPANTTPDVDAIQTLEHQAIAELAARAGTVTLKQCDTDMPLPEGEPVLIVEFISALESGILERGGVTGFVGAVQANIPNTETLVLSPNATLSSETLDKVAAWDGVTVVATRNAHLHEAQRNAARAVIKRASRPVLVCLRNPYDAQVLDAPTVICTCGDATPSLHAAADLLAGDFQATGRLTVPLDKPSNVEDV